MTHPQIWYMFYLFIFYFSPEPVLLFQAHCNSQSVLTTCSPESNTKIIMGNTPYLPQEPGGNVGESSLPMMGPATQPYTLSSAFIW